MGDLPRLFEELTALARAVEVRVSAEHLPLVREAALVGLASDNCRVRFAAMTAKPVACGLSRGVGRSPV